MKKVSTNPLKTLSKNELKEFIEAIDSNFSVKIIKGVVVQDLHKRWFDLHKECLKYAYWNHIKRKEDYKYDNQMTDITFGCIVKMMINEELKKIN